jgi:hypothetical protein
LGESQISNSRIDSWAPNGPNTITTILDAIDLLVSLDRFDCTYEPFLSTPWLASASTSAVFHLPHVFNLSQL